MAHAARREHAGGQPAARATGYQTARLFARPKNVGFTPHSEETFPISRRARDSAITYEFWARRACAKKRMTFRSRHQRHLSAVWWLFGSRDFDVGPVRARQPRYRRGDRVETLLTVSNAGRRMMRFPPMRRGPPARQPPSDNPRGTCLRKRAIPPGHPRLAISDACGWCAQNQIPRSGDKDRGGPA